MQTAEYLRYDVSKYPFQEMLKAMFGLRGDLSQAHTLFPESTTMEVLTQKNAVKTKFHEMYYASPLYTAWRELYYRFLREEIFPLYPTTIQEFVVQKDPSFRIDLPNNTSIGIRDGEAFDPIRIGLHCDHDFGHPPQEINYILPFTDMYGENSVYVESAPGLGDFTPITMSYGTFFRFWGNKCRHHNRINTTGVSRLSYDFRVFPKEEYVPSTDAVSYHNRKFLIGDYYTTLSRTAPSDDESHLE